MMPESPYVATPPPLGRLRMPRTKRSLATVLRERGALSLPHAVEVALDICDALSTAHANGVVHGQLGLGCVRLAFTPESGPRDVEIFTLEADAEDSLAVPVAPFLEPERPGGARRVDERSDVWALGALLYTMLTGVAPPARDGASAVDPSTGASSELPLDGAPRSLAALIESCLASDPASRPGGADEIAERIASFATWPPDQFARIGARREKRAAAERVRRQLEQRGLGNLPSVLDKLDDAALARAQRPTTASLSSLLHQDVRRSTEAAMNRLMTAVHEGTDEARVELAARLPSLVDFDDDDDDVLPALVKEDEADDERASFAPVVSPLTAIPVVLDEPLLSTPPPAFVTTERAPRTMLRTVATVVGAVLAIVLGAGSIGYALSARASTTTTTTTTSADVPATATATSETAARATPAPPAIPVVAASALPEAPPITPASLPEAKLRAPAP